MPGRNILRLHGSLGYSRPAPLPSPSHQGLMALQAFQALFLYSPISASPN